MSEISQETNLLLQSYYTFCFLMELKNNDFLESEYYKEMKFNDPTVRSQIDCIGIDNQGCLLMSLYAMLVIPKQILFEKFKDKFDELNRKFDEQKTFVESTYSSDKNGVDYVRHIRNAVAHARVDFEPQKIVTFKDESSGKQKCTITVPLSSVSQLLEKMMEINVEYMRSLLSKR